MDGQPSYKPPDSPRLLATGLDDDQAIKQLFHFCDSDGSGFITKAKLTAICEHLPQEDITEVFEQLDRDGDGKISLQEFENSFHGIMESFSKKIQHHRRQSLLSNLSISQENINYLSQLQNRNDSQSSIVRQDSDQSNAASEDVKPGDMLQSLDAGFSVLSCQEQICELYQTLHATDQGATLAQFEEVLLSVIKDVRQQQSENERLENSFKREKEQHKNHVRQMEEEMEQQVQRVESRVRAEERERAEAEKHEIRMNLEAELTELKENFSHLQKMESHRNQSPSDDMHSRMDEVTQENRTLRSSLVDAQTSLALLRSEMVTWKQQVDEKSRELNSEKNASAQYGRENDNLTQQVQLLQEANQKLHDTNDDLRHALENSQTSRASYYRGSTASLLPQRKYSIIGNYLQQSTQNMSGVLGVESEAGSMVDLRNEGQRGEKPDIAIYSQGSSSVKAFTGRLPHDQSCETDDFSEDIDSGTSTFREDQFESSDTLLDDPIISSSRKHHRYLVSEKTINDEEPIQEDDIEDQLDGSSSLGYPYLDQTDHDEDLDVLDPQSFCEPAGGRQSKDGGYNSGSQFDRPDSACSNSSLASTNSVRPNSPMQSRGNRRRLPTAPNRNVRSKKSTISGTDPLVKEPQISLALTRKVSGHPERMYKVVLCGDAAVGKSSFIMRLCNNRFVNNMHSTLGVDFQTKVLEVDGRVIALQLWDTAGQERFRSIAKSYFRRADGVLLLYDCTYERSFLNVREWVQAVEDSASKRLPIMIIGNKIDIREEQSETSRRFVTYDDGNHLAKQYSAQFIETSAKDGSNILESVTELARVLRTNEDIEVKNVGLTLQDMKETKNSTCCK